MADEKTKFPMSKMEVIDDALAFFISYATEGSIDMPPNWVYWAQEMCGHDRTNELMGEHFRGDENEARETALERVGELEVRCEHMEKVTSEAAVRLKKCNDTIVEAIDIKAILKQTESDLAAMKAENIGIRTQFEIFVALVCNSKHVCDCGEPATCVGAYEGAEFDFACDTCCGHGCEDGKCFRLHVPIELRTRAEEAEAEVARLLVSLEKNRDEHYRREEKAIAEGVGRVRPTPDEHGRKILEGIVDGEVRKRHELEATLATTEAELRAERAANEDLSELVQNNRWMSEDEWEEYELERDRMRADAREVDE